MIPTSIPTSLSYPNPIEFLTQLNLCGRFNLSKLPNPIPHPRRLSKDPAILPKLTPDLSDSAANQPAAPANPPKFNPLPPVSHPAHHLLTH